MIEPDYTPNLTDKVEYGVTVTKETAKFGAAGYALKLLYDISNSIGTSIPEKAKAIAITLEEHVTNPLLEAAGPVGDGVLAAETWRVNLYKKALGINKENSEATVENQPEQQNYTTQNTQAIVAQPEPYQQNYANTGNIVLAASVIIGLVSGLITARKEYNIRKGGKK